MDAVRLENISKSFGNNKVIDDLSLTIEPGKFVTLLGPSGCGKTTLLRCIAGLEKPDEGQILINDRLMFSAGELANVPAKERGLSMVFQTYAVWPHMTVFDNVSFGLQLQDLSKDQIEQRVYRMLESVGIRDLAERFPFEVSGGQQQRVSLARALVVDPAVLLMDEPLSNLDARLRMLMRTELKRIHREIGATVVYVTHDQLEALTLSDEVVVLHEGKIQQIADPITLYEYPDNLFVANFIGTLPINLIDMTVVGSDTSSLRLHTENDGFELTAPQLKRFHQGDKVVAAVRPEDIDITKAEASQHGNNASNAFEVYDVQCIGSSFIIRARRNGLEFVIETGKKQGHHLQIGEKIHVRPAVEQIRLYDPASRSIIRN